MQPSVHVNTKRGLPERGEFAVELLHAPVRSVQPGTQRVPMLTLRMTAPCERDVNVESLRVWRRGLGASSDILSVYAMKGGRRLVEGRQLSRSGSAELHFRDLRIPACETEEISILADFSQDAAVAGEHWMTVEQANDIGAGTSKVSLIRDGSPQRQRTAGGRVRGGISVEYLRLIKTVLYGKSRTVMRIRLAADGVEDHIIRAITVTNNGSASNADIQNMFLRVGRNRSVSSVVRQLDGEIVRFVLDPPLLLKKNQKRLLELQADVLASRRRTLQLIIEQPSDIESEPAHLR